MKKATWKNPLLEATADPRSMRFLRHKVGTTAAPSTESPGTVAVPQNHAEAYKAGLEHAKSVRQKELREALQGAPPSGDPECRSCGFAQCICPKVAWSVPLVPLPIITLEVLGPGERQAYRQMPQCLFTPVALLLGHSTKEKGEPVSLLLHDVRVGCTSLLPSAAPVDVRLLKGPVGLVRHTCEVGFDISLELTNPSPIARRISACVLGVAAP